MNELRKKERRKEWLWKDGRKFHLVSLLLQFYTTWDVKVSRYLSKVSGRSYDK